jgi:hypothetical protein
MNQNLEDILDGCLRRMQAGVSLEECLAAYPEAAAELRPLLTLAASIAQAETPAAAPEAVERGLQRMLARFGDKFSSGSSLLAKISIGASRFNPFAPFARGKEAQSMRLILRMASVFLLAGVLVCSLVVNASASSLPGDSLYGVKLAWENVRLGLAVGPQHDDLANQFQADHQREVQALMDHHRPVKVRFEGKVISISGTAWQVGILSVNVNANTLISGAPAVGDSVLVTAQVQADNTLLGLSIEKLPLPTPTQSTQVASRTPRPTNEKTREPDERMTAYPILWPTGWPTGWPTNWPGRPLWPTGTFIFPTHAEGTHPARPTQDGTHRPDLDPTYRPTWNGTACPTHSEIGTPRPTHAWSGTPWPTREPKQQQTPVAPTYLPPIRQPTHQPDQDHQNPPPSGWGTPQPPAHH